MNLQIAQRYIKHLPCKRRSGETDIQLISRHERRVLIFALLTDGFIIPVAAFIILCAPWLWGWLLVWIIIGGVQTYKWLRCQQIRIFLQNEAVF